MASTAVLAPAELATLIDKLGLGKPDILMQVGRLGHVARTHLVTIAQRRLRTTARDYVKAIQPLDLTEKDGEFVATIELRGGLPNMVEHGAEAWDLRTTILKPGTRRLKTSKAGFYYLSIPFRHMLPGASGKNAPPMGQAHSKAGQAAHHRAFRGGMEAKAARAMGRAVARGAQKLSATWSRSLPQGGHAVIHGGRLNTETDVTKHNKPVPVPVLRPRHAGDIFAGMQREEQFYEAEAQNQYVTFRTISNNPASFREDTAGGGKPERNWTHPGIQARHLVPETAGYVQGVIAQGVFGA